MQECGEIIAASYTGPAVTIILTIIRTHGGPRLVEDLLDEVVAELLELQCPMVME